MLGQPIRNGVEHNDADDREMIAATQANKKAFMMTAFHFRQYIRLYSVFISDRPNANSSARLPNMYPRYRQHRDTFFVDRI